MMNMTSTMNNTRALRGMFIHRLSHLSKTQKIKQELRELGMTGNDLWRSGSAYLARIIQPSETAKGIVYQYDESGSTILLATDQRIIFLEQKTLYISEDEVSYETVTGISYTRFGQQLTVVLHTDTQDFMVRTTAHAGAEEFLRYAESQSMKAARTELTGGRIR